MANLLCTDSELAAVANAIRSKGGTSAALGFPMGMANAVNALNVGTGLSPAASAADIRNGKKAVVNRQTITGTMSEKAAATITPTESAQEIAAGQYLTGKQTIAAIPSTYVGSGVTRKAAATITPTESTQEIAANQYLTGKQTIAAVPSNYVGSGITRKAAATITPSESAKEIAAGQYLTGKQTIAAIPSDYVGSAITKYENPGAYPGTQDRVVFPDGFYTPNGFTVFGVTTQNISSANIKKGVSVKVGHGVDPGAIISVVGGYESSISKTVVNGTRTTIGETTCPAYGFARLFSTTPPTGASPELVSCTTEGWTAPAGSNWGYVEVNAEGWGYVFIYNNSAQSLYIPGGYVTPRFRKYEIAV